MTVSFMLTSELLQSSDAGSFIFETIPVDGHLSNVKETSDDSDKGKHDLMLGERTVTLASQGIKQSGRI